VSRFTLDRRRSSAVSATVQESNGVHDLPDVQCVLYVAGGTCGHEVRARLVAVLPNARHSSKAASPGSTPSPTGERIYGNVEFV
jgi:hypothetical protein